MKFTHSLGSIPENLYIKRVRNDSDALNKIWVLFDSNMQYNFFASILSSFEYGSKIWLILANIVFEYYRLFLFSVHIFSL